ncbi:MAG: hypothetical protein HC836_26255 [Richelia sp. RM2_1_2]|nr:hypothetical protein [Richelia sp. RM2_1_2]
MALEDELRDTNELLRQFVSTAGGQVRRGSSSAARSAGPGFVFQSTAAAASTLSKALGIGATTASALGSSLLGFNKNIRSAGDLLKTVFAGTVLGGLAAVVSDTIDVYKEFIGIGQSFNGQMINMAATAADTSQSMEQMIKGFKAAGAAGAVLGIEQFSRLSSAVRASSRQFGSFGLTIEETNEYLGDQIETMRALGVLDNITHHETITNFQELQNQTLALSSVTGKSREEILKQTMAMQKNNAILSGVLAGVPDQIRGSIQKSLQNATNVFAALPGQTGEMLNTALTSSLALGSSFMNEQFGALATMAPQLGLAIDDIAKAAKNGGDTAEAAISAVDAMQDISGEQLSYLSALAAGGDQAATELLQMYSSVKSINTDALRERIKQKQRFGGIEQEFLNFQQNFSILSGEFRGMILKFFNHCLVNLIV